MADKQIYQLPASSSFTAGNEIAMDAEENGAHKTYKVNGQYLAEALKDIGGYIDEDHVYNGLDKDVAGYALDARKGKALNEEKLDKANVYNGLDKAVGGYALDARQGNALNKKKADQSVIAPVESSTTASRAYAVGEYFILNGTMYVATAAIASGGTITAGTNCQAATVGGEVSDVRSALNTSTVKAMLLDENIPDTVQSIVFDSSGNVASITHVYGSTTVRTDAFTFGENTITEVRTLNTGESLTLVTNTTTLQTTVTYEAA